MVTAESLKTAGLNEIALVVIKNWHNMSPAAKPYVEAMSCLRAITDKFYADSGYSVVAYFLCNAAGFRGDVAKLVKAELKARMKKYEKENSYA